MLQRWKIAAHWPQKRSRNLAVLTFSSTTPAFSMFPLSSNFQRNSGTRFSRPICRRHFISPQPCLPSNVAAAGWGRIINIASVHGLVASSFKSAYVAAKHGLVGLTKVVALETAGSGVTCNSIRPGWVLTPMVDRQIEDKMSNRVPRPRRGGAAVAAAAKQPSGQFATPAQIGALVVFLCSESAANLTGASLPVDERLDSPMTDVVRNASR